jgi:transposase-like protein
MSWYDRCKHSEDNKKIKVVSEQKDEQNRTTKHYKCTECGQKWQQG